MGVSENAAYPQTQVQKGEHDDEPKDFVCPLHAELKDLGVLFWTNPYIHVYIYIYLFITHFMSVVLGD